MNTITISLPTEHDVIALGGMLAHMMERPAILFLEGPLGAGKTTFTRGFVQNKGNAAKVKSPTYTLVEPYDFSPYPIYHFDLYRLSDPEELLYIGVEEYFNGEAFCIVEWPQKGEGFLPAPDFRLKFDYNKQGRTVNICCKSSAEFQMLSQLDVQ